MTVTRVNARVGSVKATSLLILPDGSAVNCSREIGNGYGCEPFAARAVSWRNSHGVLMV